MRKGKQHMYISGPLHLQRICFWLDFTFPVPMSCLFQLSIFPSFSAFQSSYLFFSPLLSYPLSLIIQPFTFSPTKEREMDFWTNMPFVSIMLVKLYLSSILSLTYIGLQIPQGFLGPQALLCWLSWIMSPDFQEFQLPINLTEANGNCSPGTSRNSRHTRKLLFISHNLDWKSWFQAPCFQCFKSSLIFCFILVPLSFLIEESCVITSNHFQTVQNHVVGTVPKTYHHRHWKHYCSSPLPCAILWHHEGNECCALPDVWEGAAVGKEEHQVTLWRNAVSKMSAWLLLGET